MAATVELSTPPDMATAIVLFGIQSELSSQLLLSASDGHYQHED
jgi:hypothetical protein